MHIKPFLNRSNLIEDNLNCPLFFLNVELHCRSKYVPCFICSGSLSVACLNIYYETSVEIKANGQASQGKYVAGSVTGVGAEAGLFVANHAY